MFFVFLFLFSLSLQAAPLSSVEKQIQDYVVEQQDSAFNLLARLVNIGSGTMDTAGIYQVGEIVHKQLADLGFKTRWVKQPATMHRAGTFIAERKGSPGAKRLLLIGHLDTVFPSDSGFKGFEQKGERATGPGVIDDKGGVVVILYALKALAAADALEDTTITVVLTGDEEDVGKPATISRKALMEAAQRSDVALDFEWSFGLDTATIGRRGVSHWRIETTGNEAHSSTIFESPTGDGAIFELARILNTFHTKLAEEKNLSFNPGIILGGNSWDYDKDEGAGRALGKDNVVAKAAFAKGDLRFLNEKQQKNAENAMREIVAAKLPGTTAEISFQQGIPAMIATPANKKLLQEYSQASVDLGHAAVKALDPGLRGAADISYIAGSMAANLAGLGPVGTGAHTTHETLDIPSLSIATQRAALLIYRLTHPQEGTTF